MLWPLMLWPLMLWPPQLWHQMLWQPQLWDPVVRSPASIGPLLQKNRHKKTAPEGGFDGSAPGEIRTPDPLIRSQML